MALKDPTVFVLLQRSYTLYLEAIRFFYNNIEQ